MNIWRTLAKNPLWTLRLLQRGLRDIFTGTGLEPPAVRPNISAADWPHVYFPLPDGGSINFSRDWLVIRSATASLRVGAEHYEQLETDLGKLTAALLSLGTRINVKTLTVDGRLVGLAASNLSLELFVDHKPFVTIDGKTALDLRLMLVLASRAAAARYSGRPNEEFMLEYQEEQVRAITIREERFELGPEQCRQLAALFGDVIGRPRLRRKLPLGDGTLIASSSDSGATIALCRGSRCESVDTSRCQLAYAALSLINYAG